MNIHIHSDRADLHVAASLYLAAMQTAGIALTPPDGADIIINIDSIHNTGLLRGKKTIYWELDDNLHQGKNTELYDVDLLYIVSKANLPLYPPKTHWLPVAMEPTIHYDWGFPKPWDVVFVGKNSGNSCYEYRKKVLDFLNGNVGLLETTCQPQDYPKVLSQGKLLLNVNPQEYGRPPLIITRFFESMGIGCCLQDYHESLDDFAVRNRHYIGFDSPQEAFENVLYYKDHEDERNTIVKNARLHVLSYHTWKHRLLQILHDVETL